MKYVKHFDIRTSNFSSQKIPFFVIWFNISRKKRRKTLESRHNLLPLVGASPGTPGHTIPSEDYGERKVRRLIPQDAAVGEFIIKRFHSRLCSAPFDITPLIG